MEPDEGVGVVPVAAGLVSDVHNDRLQPPGVPDELVQEAHPHDPRTHDQIVRRYLHLSSTTLSLQMLSKIKVYSENIHYVLRKLQR